MLMLLVQMTQHMMADQLQYLAGPEATVLEVKVTEGLGHTIDVILSNGTLRCNDKIILCGMNGKFAPRTRYRTRNSQETMSFASFGTHISYAWGHEA